MDPVCHTLLAITLGRTADRREGSAAAPAVWAAIAGSLIPDIDIVTGLSPSRADFLVHHRGWTHTILLLPVLAIAAAALVLAFRALRVDPTPGRPMEKLRAVPWRTALPPLARVAGVAIAFHFFFDYLNDYGVHPFAPFSRAWSYGDSMSVVEPLLWWCFLPFVMAQAATKKRRRLWLGLGVAPIAFLTFAAPAAILAAVALFAFGSWWLQRKKPGTGVPWAAAGIVISIFVIGSLWVRARVAGELLLRAGDEQRLDIVSTPAVSNPFCWRIVTVGVEGSEYVAREGFASTIDFFDAQTCQPEWGPFTRLRTAPMVPAKPPSDRRFHWIGEFRAPVGDIKKEAEDCIVKGLLTFIRVPYWKNDGHRHVVGDLRYDLQKGEAWAEVRLDNVLRACPGTPWIPPRQDLLER